MRNLPFNLCIAFLAGFLMDFVTPAFSSPTPTATIIPTPTVTATTTVTASITATPTPQPPTVTTGDATVDYGNGCLVTLNGTVNANGLLTTTWFEYGETSGSYSSTTATQTISGTSDTTVSNEIEVSFTFNCNTQTYYYKLVAQNSAGKSYGSENTFESCYYFLDCFGCTVSGYVTDAATGKGIKDATILIDGVKQAVTSETGYYDYRSYSGDYYNTCGELEVTALADGYTLLTKYGNTEECSCSTTVNFELQPTLSTTPTPTVSTTPTSNCVPKSISASQSKLTLKRKLSKDVTITVKGENDCLVDGETVATKINNAGKKCISILPSSAVTNSNGEAKFTITAKRVGNTRVIFKTGILKNSIIVRVRR